MTVAVAVTEVLEDGSQAPVDGELAAALAGAVEQFTTMPGFLFAEQVSA
jgi:hypothetical protein